MSCHNSRAKGNRAEREWRDELRSAGWIKARRGQQFSGTPESPDVVCPELGFIHFEVKHRARGNPFDFIAEAASDAGAGKLPAVAYRRNRHPFIVILRADDFFKMLRNCDLEALRREVAK